MEIPSLSGSLATCIELKQLICNLYMSYEMYVHNPTVLEVFPE